MSRSELACESDDSNQEKILPHFEDEFSNATSKEINRLFISYFLHEFLPLVYEQSKKR